MAEQVTQEQSDAQLFYGGAAGSTATDPGAERLNDRAVLYGQDAGQRAAAAGADWFYRSLAKEAAEREAAANEQPPAAPAPEQQQAAQQPGEEPPPEIVWPDYLDDTAPIAKELRTMLPDPTLAARVVALIPKYEAIRDEALTREILREKAALQTESRRLGAETLEDARAAYAMVANVPGFSQLLTETGLGDDPRMVRAFAEFARMLRHGRR